MKRLFGFLFVVVLAAAAFGGGIWYTRTHSAATAKPGEKEILYWVDPMHPAYKSDKPGTAPDCGMELEPVYKDGSQGVDPTASNLPPNTFRVDPDKQQLIGVTFAEATPASEASSVRAVGKVAVDETHITRVHPKIEGWISKTFADFAGQLIHQGDPLLTIYSPEMLASQQEYLLALKARDLMKAGPDHESHLNSEALVQASRRRLELWDLGQAQIDALEQTKEPVRSITIYSPASGFITSRNSFPGQKVTPETELYALADLSRAWILADVFETDAAKIQIGQNGWVTLPSAGGRGFSARVSYIQPQVDPTTRTLKIRLEAPNPDMKLRPDMFVNVEFRMSSTARITVPADAVVNTGTRQTVFVDLGDGHLESRSVEIGDRSGDRVQILRGLKAGERVVASGAFLIDSEAQLKNTAGDHGHD